MQRTATQITQTRKKGNGRRRRRRRIPTKRNANGIIKIIQLRKCIQCGCGCTCTVLVCGEWQHMQNMCVCHEARSVDRRNKKQPTQTNKRNEVNETSDRTNENDETNFMLLWPRTICANRGMRQANPKIV